MTSGFVVKTRGAEPTGQQVAVSQRPSLEAAAASCGSVARQVKVRAARDFWQWEMVRMAVPCVTRVVREAPRRLYWNSTHRLASRTCSCKSSSHDIGSNYLAAHGTARNVA